MQCSDAPGKSGFATNCKEFDQTGDITFVFFVSTAGEGGLALYEQYLIE